MQNDNHATVVRILSFQAWCEQNNAFVTTFRQQYAEPDDCSECDGDGRCECECGDVHDCAACAGTGKIDEGKTANEQLRDIYEHTLNTELAALSKWLGVVKIKTSEKPSLANEEM